ncbi:MAG: hypothetical protein OXF01_17560 [Gemmatimonadetes bacterium]|nr:hypothetical protein [Gemmatimonadota bacterium]
MTELASSLETGSDGRSTTLVTHHRAGEKQPLRPADGDALGWILGAESTELPFVTEILGRRAVLVHGGSPRRFSQLLSFEVLDSVLGTYGLSHADIRVVRSDPEVAPSDYQWGDLADPMRVAGLFADGATVIFAALHNRHAPLQRLCAALSRQAGVRTQTNIYLTPPRSQGFKPHWDSHDVFVMQVEGSKRWRFYEGGTDRPLPGQQFDPERHLPGPVEVEVTVSAGDTMYIPRGIMHAAESLDETSLHITLGLHAYTWAEFAGQCLAEAALRRSGWRDSLPFGYPSSAEDGFNEIKNQLGERLAELASDADVAAVLSARLDEVASAFRARASNYLEEATAAESLSRRDCVRLRPELASRIDVRGDRTVVISEGRELDFPRAAERTIRKVLAGKPIRAGAINDGLDWPSRKVVLSNLIRAGIAETVDSGIWDNG